MTGTNLWAFLVALLTFLFGSQVNAPPHSDVSDAASADPPTTTAAPTTATSADPSTTAPTRRTAPTSTFHSQIDRVSAAELGSSYHDGCPVGPDQLRRLTVGYRGFDGKTHTGRLVVAADWAEPLAGVFRRLYDERFPIRTMEPVTAYGSSDDASMAADNTSAFNCRAVTGGSSFSEHSYGTAIDLNPIENPYISGGLVEPDAGVEYLDRSDVRPGMITADGPVVAAFADIGWSWGGTWSSPTDFQHFSASGR